MEVLGLLPQLLHLLIGANLEVCSCASCLQVVQLLLEVFNLMTSQRQVQLFVNPSLQILSPS